MDLFTLPGAPDDLFITEALDARPRGKPDYKSEARAIQSMAFSMADDPEMALPHFVDLALRFTGADSGGLSLLEPSPAPGVFRWCFLRGTLSRFNGATTPRDYSPCGVTLDRNETVLTRRPERFYSWLIEAQVEAPEVLLVPLSLGDAKPLGTLWVLSNTEGHFTRDHANLIGDLAECVGAAAARWIRDRPNPSAAPS